MSLQMGDAPEPRMRLRLTFENIFEKICPGHFTQLAWAFNTIGEAEK